MQWRKDISHGMFFSKDALKQLLYFRDLGTANAGVFPPTRAPEKDKAFRSNLRKVTKIFNYAVNPIAT
jgi:hypothetical protein